MKFSDVRRAVYKYHIDYYAYAFKWPWYSYRKLKVIFYIECASVLIYFLLKTNITPNAVTLIYVALGVLAGVLLAIPSKPCLVIAAILLFTKPILDWADGGLARLKNITSIGGDILDNYSAYVTWAVLWAALGIYLGNSTNKIFYYLAPIPPLIFTLNIYASALERFVYHYFSKKEFRNIGANDPASEAKAGEEESTLRRAKTLIDKAFEHNTRTVDIVALLIIVETFTAFRILWAFYCAFIIWHIVVFITRLRIVSGREWAESELKKLRKILYG